MAEPGRGGPGSSNAAVAAGDGDRSHTPDGADARVQAPGDRFLAGLSADTAADYARHRDAVRSLAPKIETAP